MRITRITRITSPEPTRIIRTTRISQDLPELLGSSPESPTRSESHPPLQPTLPTASCSQQWLHELEEKARRPHVNPDTEPNHKPQRHKQACQGLLKKINQQTSVRKHQDPFTN